MITQACAVGHHANCSQTSETCACPTCHRGPCETCGATNLVKMYDGRCAPCERERVRKLGPPPVVFQRPQLPWTDR